MLSLASDQLSHDWEIVASDPADLYIYSLESEEGMTAWQQHDSHAISALLSSKLETNESVDIVLKKPLRAKNFSLTLNEAEDKIHNGSTKPTVKSKRGGKPSFFASLFSVLSKLFNKKTNLAKPSLHFSFPEQSAENTDSILDTTLLKEWIKNLEPKTPNSQIGDIVGNLIQLNRSIIPMQTRFKLLELYLQPINTLIHNQLSKGIKSSSDSHTNYIKTVHAISLLLDELTTGYKIIVDDYYQQDKHPNSNAECLVAINRTAEYLSLSIVFAYSHYFTIPSRALNHLHQLYLYNEYYKTLDKVPTSKKKVTQYSFSHIYNSVLLMGIANPSRLEQSEIGKLYDLMAKFSDLIKLAPLSGKDITASSTPIVAGHFCIDTASNRMPLSLNETAEEIRSQNQSRLLDTQSILETIEQLFLHEASTHKQDSDLDEISLLKKIVPQFNATYTRRFKREFCEGSPKTQIEIGLSAIHVGLLNGSSSQSDKWTIHNRGTGGMMISNKNFDAYHLNIGDSIGIFEDKAQPSLAIIRWMTTNKEGISHLGLEIKSHQPKAITLTPKNKAEILLGLLIPSATGRKQETTILVEKGTYLPLQELQVSEGNLSYKISVDTLINNAFNDAQFSYTVKD